VTGTRGSWSAHAALLVAHRDNPHGYRASVGLALSHSANSVKLRQPLQVIFAWSRVGAAGEPLRIDPRAGLWLQYFAVVFMGYLE
jgi:hypothetical protein